VNTDPRPRIPANYHAGMAPAGTTESGTAGYHPAVEEYLETIFELEEAGTAPLRARLVERLGVSAPSVSETVRRLEREGYLTLTEHGRDYATSIMRRHRLAERLLVDVLKVPWHQVHEEAGRLEHAISANLEGHLVRLLGDPATCPHGNPIPGSANAVPADRLVPLSDLDTGTSGEVRRISEEIESHADQLQLLEAVGLIPGQRAEMLSRDGSDIVVRTTNGDSRVPASVGAKIYVAAVA
jgi:DtxR family transcriptional regulator, iron-dependent repressor